MTNLGTCALPGIMEEFQCAVQPLIVNGHIHLETVDYSSGCLEFRLQSEDMDIVFYLSVVNKTACEVYSARSCSFFLPSRKIYFDVGHLFRALGKPNPLKREGQFYRIRERDWGEKSQDREWLDQLQSDRSLFSDISEACHLIIQELEDIRERLSPDDLDDTIRMYENQMKLSGKSPNPSVISGFYQDARSEKKMGDRERMRKFEDILQAMEPLKECFRDKVSYNVPADRFSILRFPDFNKGWGGFELLFHICDDGILRIFFTISRLHSGLTPEKKLSRGVFDYDNNMLVFSGDNVFRFLSLEYPALTADSVTNLRELSAAVQKNFPAILAAFSQRKFSDTYRQLSRTPEPDQRAIITVYKKMIVS